jgi:hypothetical protein
MEEISDLKEKETEELIEKIKLHNAILRQMQAEYIIEREEKKDGS